MFAFLKTKIFPFSTEFCVLPNIWCWLWKFLEFKLLSIPLHLHLTYLQLGLKVLNFFPFFCIFQMFAFASQSGGKFVGAQGESGDSVQPAHHFLFNRFLEFYPWTFFLQNTCNISLLLSAPCFVLWISFIEFTWIPLIRSQKSHHFFLNGILNILLANCFFGVLFAWLLWRINEFFVGNSCWIVLSIVNGWILLSIGMKTAGWTMLTLYSTGVGE